MEQTWEYDDQWYNMPDADESGQIQTAFRSKKNAEESALNANIKTLIERSDSLFSYFGEEPRLEVSKEDFEKIVADAGGKCSFDDYECELPKKLKREDAIKILAACGIKWFYVSEVEVDDNG